MQFIEKKSLIKGLKGLVFQQRVRDASKIAVKVVFLDTNKVIPRLPVVSLTAKYQMCTLKY